MIGAKGGVGTRLADRAVVTPFVVSPVHKKGPRQERIFNESRPGCQVAKAVLTPERQAQEKGYEGHSALLQGLGEIGDVQTTLVPWLLRLAHIRYTLNWRVVHVLQLTSHAMPT